MKDPRSADDGVDRPARWLQLSLPAPAPGEAILLVEALRALGARAVERQAGRVVAVFPPGSGAPETLAAEVELALRASTSLRDGAVQWRRLDRAEWLARWGGAHPPRRVSARLVVVVDTADGDGDPDVDVDVDGGEGTGASWEAKPRTGASRVVRLEPSSAFGTAEHPTTRACLRLLDGVVRAGDRVLDLGAGSGVLAIAAVLLGAGSALALEVDPVACAAARRNVERNGVGDRVEVREAAVTGRALRALAASGDEGRWDGVVANIGSEVLTPLLPELAALLPARQGKPRTAGEGTAAGWLIVSGVLPPERDRFLAAAAAVGLRPADEDVAGGWWAARLVSRTGAGPARR